MKKLIISLFATVMTAAGLVGVSGTSASAAQCDQYGVCVEPNADVPRNNNVNPRTISPNKRPKFKLKLDVPGTAVPEGRIKIVVLPLRANGSTGKAVSKKAKRTNNNGAATLTAPKLKPGVYRVLIKYIPDPNTPWERVNRVIRVKVG